MVVFETLLQGGGMNFSMKCTTGQTPDWPHNRGSAESAESYASYAPALLFASRHISVELLGRIGSPGVAGRWHRDIRLRMRRRFG